MVGRWSFPFWGWPILKVSLHVFPASLPPNTVVSQGKAAILCLVELYLSVGEAWIWGEFSTRNPVRVNSPNWGEGRLQSYDFTGVLDAPSKRWFFVWDFWTINSMMSLWWSSEFLFTGKNGVEGTVVKRSKIKIPDIFSYRSSSPFPKTWWAKNRPMEDAMEVFRKELTPSQLKLVVM